MITKAIQDKYRRVIPIPKKVAFDKNLVQLGPEWTMRTREGNEKGLGEWYRKFNFSRRYDSKKLATLILDNDFHEEEYSISITNNKMEIYGGSYKGLDYAMQTLWQISPEGLIPTGHIEDGPSLDIRGFHLNFDSFRQMDIKEALYVIKTAASLKLNTILVEYGNRFPYKEHERVAVNTTLVNEDIRRLMNMAKTYGITVIPLQQTIGHLDYILLHDYYKDFRENGESTTQICPLSPDAKALVKDLLEDIMERHPGIKYLHIGGDEARSLGMCSKCNKKAEKYGNGILYADYINEISEFVLSKGITPIVWDDMLCAYPEALKILDRRIMILYWDYWTVQNPSPYFVARYDRKGRSTICYDARWDNKWKEELNDLERQIMSDFAGGIPLEERLGEKFLELYGEYLGNEFPKMIKGCPYIEFYQEKGFKVIGAPTSLGNGDNYNSLPNYWRFIPNIKTVSERCIEAGASGVITTAWYNYHPAMFHLGIGATAQFAWGIKTKL